MSDQVQASHKSKFIDLSRPVDWNTIAIILTVVGGGLMFMAKTGAQIDTLTGSFNDFKHDTSLSIQRMEDRIDHVVDGHVAAASHL